MPTVTGRATDFITFSRTSNATVVASDGKIKWAGHNLLTNSESFDASAWTKSQSTATANVGVAPNGTTTADRIVGTGGFTWYVAQAISQAIGQKFTFGVWVKSNTGTPQTFRIFGDASNTVSSTLTATTSWQLFTLEFTATVAGSQTVGIITQSGNVAADILVWGAHLYRSDLGGMVLNPARGDAYYPTTPPNLLGFTEDFGNAAWAKTGSVTSNAELAPNGLQTADLFSGAFQSVIYQNVASSILSTPQTASVYLKRGSVSIVRLAVFKSSGGQNGCVDFDLASGSAGTPTGNFPPVNPAITSVGNGWYRCSFRTTFDTGTGIGFAIYNQSGVTGDFYLWGAQLSDSASLDAYSPVYGAAVTSAAYYAPRLDFDPVTLAAQGLLVEEQRTNLAQHSAAFDNAYWGKNKLNTTGTPAWVNVGVAPDGTLSAEKLIPNTTSAADHNISSTNVSSGNYTMSIYAKADGYSKLMLYDNGTSTGYGFDLSAGTTFAVSGISAASSPLIVPVGNGWYRCSIYVTGGTRFDVYVLNDTSYSAYSGNGTDGVLVWGAQLEAGSFATSYIPTGASTATRTADVASVSTQAFPYSATEGTVIVSADVLSVANTNSANLWSFYIDSNNIMRSWIWDGAKTTPRGTVIVAGSTSAEMTNGTVSANTQFKTGTALKQNDFAFSLNGASPATDPSGPVIAATNALWLGSLGGTAASSLNGHIRQVTYLPRRISNAELQSRSV